LERYATLGLKPYRGFIQPKLTATMKGEKATKINIEYPTSFFAQMMEYGKKYSFLGIKN
jgi:dipeptidyl-peptidase III